MVLRRHLPLGQQRIGRSLRPDTAGTQADGMSQRNTCVSLVAHGSSRLGCAHAELRLRGVRVCPRAAFVRDTPRRGRIACIQCRRNPRAVSEESEKAAVIIPHNAVDGLNLAYFSQCISAKEIKPLRGAARMYGHTVERTRGLVGIAGLQTGESQPALRGCPVLLINDGRPPPA